MITSTARDSSDTHIPFTILLRVMGFKVLIAEPIHKDGVDILRKQVEVIELPPESTIEDLKRAIVDIDALISRGFIKITKEVLTAAKRLKVIVVH